MTPPITLHSIRACLEGAVPDAVAKRYQSGIETLRKVWRGETAIPVDLGKVKEKLGEAVDDGKKAVTSAAEKAEKAVKKD